MQETDTMAIINVEVSVPELKKSLELFAKNRVKAFSLLSEEVKQGVSSALNKLLNAEMAIFLGNSKQLDNKKNGYYPEREYTLKGIGGIKVRVP